MGNIRLIVLDVLLQIIAESHRLGGLSQLGRGSRTISHFGQQTIQMLHDPNLGLARQDHILWRDFQVARGNILDELSAEASRLSSRLPALEGAALSSRPLGQHHHGLLDRFVGVHQRHIECCLRGLLASAPSHTGLLVHHLLGRRSKSLGLLHLASKAGSLWRAGARLDNSLL